MKKDRGIKFTDFNLSDVDSELKADLFYKGDSYSIVMSKGDRELIKSWQRVGYEPRFGVDVADEAKANEVIEEMIVEWQKTN